MNRIAWSWSRLSDSEECRLRGYWKFYAPKQLRWPYIENDAMREGKRKHKILENAVLALETFYDREYQDIPHMKPIVEAIRAGRDRGWKVSTELQIALTYDLKKTGWFDSDVWVRCIIDVMGVLNSQGWAIDWKSGKVYPKSDQLKLTAGILFALYPELEIASTSYVWMDQNEKTPKTYSRKGYDDIWDDFRERAELIQISQDSGEWPPSPSAFNCKWCPATAAQCPDRHHP